MTLTRIVPLGDQAVLTYFEDEPAALRFAAALRRANWSWLVDVVPAYASVGVFYDAQQCDPASVAETLRVAAADAAPGELPLGRLHVIPCCYELALDLDRVAAHAALDAAEVIRLHTETVYTVFAI